MTHREFVAAYLEKRIRVQVEPRAAAKFLSDRLLLPLVALPVLGIGVSLALIGWFWTGLAVLAAGIVVPRLIKRSASRFILMQALQDERFYLDVIGAKILQVDTAP